MQTAPGAVVLHGRNGETRIFTVRRNNRILAFQPAALILSLKKIRTDGAIVTEGVKKDKSDAHGPQKFSTSASKNSNCQSSMLHFAGNSIHHRCNLRGLLRCDEKLPCAVSPIPGW